MQIRVGYELIYNCPQPTPMMLMLNIHYTRASDIVIPDHLTTTPSTPITAYRDIFGNWCNRIVAPKGQIRLASTAVVKDSGEPDVVVASAQQHSIQDLPEETLMFLLGSRYCETDLLSQIAWNLFGHSPPGWARATISRSATSTRVPPSRPLKPSTRVKASAAIIRTSPSHFAGA